MPIYGLHLYDSVMIYAKAITDLLQIGADIYDGRLVMSRIFNHSYHSIQGFDVRKFLPHIYMCIQIFTLSKLWNCMHMFT